MRGDLIEVYKFMNSLYKCKNPFTLCSNNTTRGHKFKCNKQFCATNTRKNFICNRVINLWNSLDESTAEAPSLNSFKNRIDRHFRDFIYSERIDYNQCTTIRHRPELTHITTSQEK